jgi:tetratricopeptide (TPR) repeat protein
MQGHHVFILITNPDLSTQVLKITPTRDGFFETFVNFNYKSLPGKYSMEFAYFEKIDESKNLTFEVEQTDIPLPSEIENLNILSVNNDAEQFFEMGLYADAIKNYKIVIKNSNSVIEPLYLNALNKIGLALIELRDYEKSLSYFEQVYEINPDYPDIEKNLENSKLLIFANGTPIEEKTELSVPGWIKSAAGWWISNQATDGVFIEALEYMQNKGMIGNYEFSNYSQSFVPGWIKQIVSWWVDGRVSDEEFLKTIDYLSEKGIIVI